MEKTRSGNESVANMQKEIRKDLEELTRYYLSRRKQRQLADGNKFLTMINTMPYASCKRVSDLKKMISWERQELKRSLESKERYLPGYQISLFDEPEEVTPEEEFEIAQECNRIDTRIRWLHKCLGMCSNRNYFK